MKLSLKHPCPAKYTGACQVIRDALLSYKKRAALEKLLKALFVANVGIDVPRIHHLLKIAKDAGLQLSVDQENFLLEVTTYNIKARYPDYKQRFARKATREFTQAKVKQIKEMHQWLKQQLPQA